MDQFNIGVTASSTTGTIPAENVNTSSDPYIDNVKLLLHFSNKKPIDSSKTAAKNLLMYDETDLLIDSGKFKDYGCYIFPSGVYPLFPAGTRWISKGPDTYDLTNKNFTLEGYVSLYPREFFNFSNQILGRHTLFSIISSDYLNSTEHSLSVDPVNNTIEYRSAAYGAVISQYNPVSNFEYHHYALVRDNYVVKIFFDGVKIGEFSTTSAYDSACAAARLVVGYYDFNDNDTLIPHALFDEVRYTIGVARYSSNFTPPSNDFPDETYSDRNKYNRIAVFNFNGSLADESPYASQCALNGVSLSTTEKYDGSGSIYNNGSNGNYFYITNTDPWVTSIPDSSCMINIAIMPLELSNNPIIVEMYQHNEYGNHENYIRFFVNSSGKVCMSFNIDNEDVLGVSTFQMSGTHVFDNTNIQVNAWNNLALSIYTYGNFTIAIDGNVIDFVKILKAYNSHTSTFEAIQTYMFNFEQFNFSGSPLMPTASMNGYIDTVKITKGMAIYE